MKTKNKLSLYVHIPFCVRKCDYCDFLSFPCGQYDRAAYISALLQEIAVMGKHYAAAKVDTVFIGGGTPTVCSARELENILTSIRGSFSLEKDCEFTVEANPGTVDGDKLRCLRENGANRISFGLQSTRDAELQKLGRIHDYATFLNNYELARRMGFDNINVDLMSALPGQTVEDVLLNADRIIALAPEHISAYSLIIEEGTRFHELYETKSDLLGAFPDDETEREMAHLLEQRLSDAGYEPYEISNYAKPGYACRHNMGYWTGHHYLGLGLGASSMVNSIRWKNTDDMGKYCVAWNDKAADSVRERIGEQACLSKQEQMEEFMFLGLRMHCGVSTKLFWERFSCEMFVLYKDWIDKMIAGGLLQIACRREQNNSTMKMWEDVFWQPSQYVCVPYRETDDCRYDNSGREIFLQLTRKGRDLANYVMAGFLLDSE